MSYAEQLTLILMIAFSTLTWKTAKAIAEENKLSRIPGNPQSPSWPTDHGTINHKEDVFPKSTFD